MKTNKLMKAQLTLLVEGDSNPFPEDLCKLLDSKFIEVNDCYILESMASSSIREFKLNEDGTLPDHFKQTYTDRTGFEYFVSKIHLEDYVAENHLQYSLVLLRNTFHLFHAQYGMERSLTGIISYRSTEDSQFGPTRSVAYHLNRKGESYPRDSRPGVRSSNPHSGFHRVLWR